MGKYYKPTQLPQRDDSAAEQPESMADFARREREPVLVRAQRDRALLERELRALHGDVEIDRAKDAGQL